MQCGFENNYIIQYAHIHVYVYIYIYIYEVVFERVSGVFNKHIEEAI